MRVNKYPLKSGDTFTYFEFFCVGINGAVIKLIEFQKVSSTLNLYNLSFGDRNLQSGETEDLAVTNNGDTKRFLELLLQRCMSLDRYPEALVSELLTSRKLKCVYNSFYHNLNSGRVASLLRQDSTRFFQKPLRWFLNAFASLGTEPADVLLQ